jgi:DNA modification methylase
VSVATFHVGDVFDVMARIPDASIDLIVTSPPFLALRSYLPADHPDKAKEIGSEATPAAFLSTLLALTREWRRVLAPHGSLCVELGDTYSGAGGTPSDAGKTYHNRNNDIFDGGQYVIRTRGDVNPGGTGWPLDKSLCLLPTLYPASLAYGRNLLAPDDVIEPLRVRNLIVWHRPNPPVGALGDKVRPSTSYVTIACTRRDRWFDLDAERGESVREARPNEINGTAGARKDGQNHAVPHAGAPPLDYWQLDEDDPEHQAWTIPTQPYAGAHYATFPIALPRRLIRLMCPQHVCRTCGQPRRRIVGDAEYVNARTRQPAEKASWQRDDFVMKQGAIGRDNGSLRSAPTLGWSDCGHDNYRRGHVLDPFAGSGTTLAAATEQGRDATGIDLDPDNYWLARQRIGIFLEEAM